MSIGPIIEASTLQLRQAVSIAAIRENAEIEQQGATLVQPSRIAASQAGPAAAAKETRSTTPNGSNRVDTFA